MRNGGMGRDRIALFVGQLGLAQTYYQIVSQLRKMSGALFIAEIRSSSLR
jgi:hypothetical protein